MKKSYYWLSFRDPEKNENLGVAIIEDAEDLAVAVSKAHSLEINPGGEVLGVLMNKAQFNSEGLESNRLYTRQEMLDNDYKIQTE